LILKDILLAIDDVECGKPQFPRWIVRIAAHDGILDSR
jgi:hypothetical protein